MLTASSIADQPSKVQVKLFGGTTGICFRGGARNKKLFCHQTANLLQCSLSAKVRRETTPVQLVCSPEVQFLFCWLSEAATVRISHCKQSANVNCLEIHKSQQVIFADWQAGQRNVRALWNPRNFTKSLFNRRENKTNNGSGKKSSQRCQCTSSLFFSQSWPVVQRATENVASWDSRWCFAEWITAPGRFTSKQTWGAFEWH